MAKQPPDPYRVEIRAVKRGQAVVLNKGDARAEAKTPADGLYIEAHHPTNPRAVFIAATDAWAELDKLID